METRKSPMFELFARELKQTEHIEYDSLIKALQQRELGAKAIYCRVYQKVLSHEAPAPVSKIWDFWMNVHRT